MKRIAILSMLFYIVVQAADLPFNRGVNLTNWFQASAVGEIQFTKYTEQDFRNIKSLGCDVVRLPINLHAMTGGAPDYIIDSLFYYFLDRVVDMAESSEMHLILDNHSFDPSVDTAPDIDKILIPVWTQLAGHYKDRGAYIYYEVLNEPHGIEDTTWNRIQRRVVEAIRTVDQTHTIIVGPAGWNSYYHLQNMPNYADDNLIYTFHFYDPFMFTHQGASWVNPSMEPLAGVPFPYDASRMPACPPGLVGSWIESSLNNYPNEGTVAHVQELINIPADFKEARNVPLFCGEFGVYMPNSDHADRVFWYDVVRTALEEKGIGWTIWDYHGGFGLFKKGSMGIFEHDVDIPIVEALGLIPPEQSDYIREPDTCGFYFYQDYMGQNLLESGWPANGTVNYYSKDDPAQGDFCIHWSGSDQYGYIGFQFFPLKDLSFLLDKGYAVDFWVKGNTAGAKFDIRFVDSKTDDPQDHPWRMAKTIDESMANWDGGWQHIQIPLRDFYEQGSWDNGWFEPQGLFDWTAVEHFQIVAEQQSMKGVSFWFDDIRVLNPENVAVEGEETLIKTFQLQQNYPNPFNPETLIHYTLFHPGNALLEVYNPLGQKVRTLVNQKQRAGGYSVLFHANDLASSVYFYKLAFDGKQKIRKMILIR